MDEPQSKFIVLVPLSYHDGAPVPERILIEFQKSVYELGGGFTAAGTVQGAYRMADGTPQIDRLLQYWICVAKGDEEALKNLVARLGATLGQESMYFERTNSSVFFVLPAQGQTEC